MASNIKVYQERLKKVQFTWHQTASPSSPVIDLTSATCVVRSTSLPVYPTIAILNAAGGLCELTFLPECSRKVPGIHHVVIALTFTVSPGYSPDPASIEVAVI